MHPGKAFLSGVGATSMAAAMGWIGAVLSAVSPLNSSGAAGCSSRRRLGSRRRGADTLAPIVVGAVEQAKRDLAALRLYEFDRGDRPAALPRPLRPRHAAWQAALASPALMRGTPLELARWQGRRVDDWRDEQPGRMLHEAHTGPLELLQFNPRGRYYGSVTTSAFYPFVVSELWHWTGDAVLVRPLAEAALRALRWLDEGGDLDGDGFYEYQTRSPQGVKNQG
jgi:glycogen debranching enzyme